MPEALVAPKRSQERRKDAVPAHNSSFWSKAWDARRSARAKLFIFLGLAVSVGVPVNALYFQDARHPAPLFQATVTPGEPVRRAAAQEPATPAKAETAKSDAKKAEPTKLGQVSDQIAQLLGGGAKTQPKGKAVAAKEPAPKEAHAKDALAKGQVDKTATGKIAAVKPSAVKTAAPKSSDSTKTHDAKANAKAKTVAKAEAPKKDAATAKSADKSVVLAQRALAKLGYALHQDGVYGGTTREAVEKFERANGMPAKGELTPKVLKLLTQRSGVALR